MDRTLLTEELILEKPFNMMWKKKITDKSPLKTQSGARGNISKSYCIVVHVTYLTSGVNFQWTLQWLD